MGKRPPLSVYSDDGPTLTAWGVRRWLGRVGSDTLNIEPGWLEENGNVESFNAKLPDELSGRESFHTLRT